ncbi:putative acetyl-CoA synthetase [Streptomyces sp. Tu6071]|nr:putative acetyl-CoA synthetase [Streptomyces sp. Tu6071]
MVLLAVLGLGAARGRLAEFDAADLAGDGLGQRAELQSAQAFVRGEDGARVGEEELRGRGVRGVPLGEDDVRLGDVEPYGIGRGHDGRLGDGGVFEQRALQLEGADLVVARLEDVVGAAHVGEVAVLVPGADVARPVVPAGRRRGGAFLVAVVAAHEADGAGREVEADLALGGARCAGHGVEEFDREAGAGAAHGAGLEGLARGVGDGDGGLGLAEAVADRDAPGAAHVLDDLGVEGFPGGDDGARRGLEAAQVGLDEHAPHGGRGAEARDARAVHLGHEAARVEARVVEDEDGRLGVPRCEEVRPGVLRPAGRRDVEVDVPRAQPDPVHRREVAHRVGEVGVLDEFGAGGGTGGEVEHEGLVGAGGALGDERGARGGGLGVVVPAGDGRADGDAGPVAGDLRELLQVGGAGDDVAHLAALDAVAQVEGAEERGRRDDDGAQLHRGEHEFPQLGLVAEHEEDAVARGDAEAAQPVRGARGAQGQFGEGQFQARAVLLDDVERGALVALGDPVEPVERPVEQLGAGPREAGVGRRVVLAVAEEEVAGGAEGGGRGGFAVSGGRFTGRGGGGRCRHVSSRLRNHSYSS